MCMVCIDLNRLSMTLFEAEANLYELGRTERNLELARHNQDLFDAIYNMDLDEIGFLLEKEEK